MFNSYTFLNCILINIFDMIAISKMYYMEIITSALFKYNLKVFII